MADEVGGINYTLKITLCFAMTYIREHALKEKIHFKDLMQRKHGAYIILNIKDHHM